MRHRWISAAQDAATASGRTARRNDRGCDRRCDGAHRRWRPGGHNRGGVAGVESRRMIGPTGAVRVMVATRPVDFRKGADGLAALVRESLAADPFSGAVYVFRAKRADRIKLVFWDGTGPLAEGRRRRDPFVGCAIVVA